MNQVVIYGRVATEIKYRLTKSGKDVVNFLVAVPSTHKKNKDGVIPTDFPKVVAWGKKAEVCRDFLHKGRPCIIKGHITTEIYDKDGQTIRSTYITVEDVDFLGYRKQYANGTPKEDNEEVSADIGLPELEDMRGSYNGIPDEEIPF